MYTCRETYHRGHVRTTYVCTTVNTQVESCVYMYIYNTYIIYHDPRHLVIIDGRLQGVAGVLDDRCLGEDCFPKPSTTRATCMQHDESSFPPELAHPSGLRAVGAPPSVKTGMQQGPHTSHEHVQKHVQAPRMFGGGCWVSTVLACLIFAVAR